MVALWYGSRTEKRSHTLAASTVSWYGAVHWAEHISTGLCLHSQSTSSARWCFQLKPGCFYQIRSEAKSQGTLLPDHHPYVKMIKRIGMKVAQKASDDSGVSGHMEHMKVRYSSSGSLSNEQMCLVHMLTCNLDVAL